jgi:uncharacterized OB-fold protein
MAEQVPFKEGVLTAPLSPLDKVRLKGIKCKDCGALTMGESEHCINCTSTNIEEYIFSNKGKIYAHTIIRHCPPPPYPQDDFKPFPAAWVQLDDGMRIITEIADCGLEDVKVDMPVELVMGKGWEDENGNEVIMYKFRPTK